MTTDYEAAEQPIDDCIVDLIEMAGGSPHSDLVKEIILTATKLVGDGTSRGDLKILNSTLKELRYAFKVFAPWRDQRKVTIFGSARLTPDRPAYRQAVEFARRMAEIDYMIITGAGPGIMQAGHEGAGRDKSFGVNIRLPFEQSANPVIQDDPKLINFKYFFTRKLSFVKETSAIVLFPGGFGTHDEGFEALTLMQTGKGYLMPLIYLDPPGDRYWDEWEAYVDRQLVNRGMVAPEDKYLFTVTEDVEHAVREIQAFYSVYHSQRYVRDTLVLRVNRRISEAVLAGLNEDFSEILHGGVIEQRGPFPDEANEPKIAHLPRIAMKFDRQHFGQLRALIDRINDWDREKGVVVRDA